MDGVGEKGDIMYKEPRNKILVKRARRGCTEIVKGVERILREEYGIPCQVGLVGSGKRKMILFNGKDRHIDFDYNMLVYCGFNYNPFELRNTVRVVFNRVMAEYGLGNVYDSTSSLTTKMIYFTDEPEIQFHMDLAIVTVENEHFHRLKYDKRSNHVIWNTAVNMKKFKEKEAAVYHSCPNQVLGKYIKKKNLHINDEENHPSFNCYIEAINELYNKYCS